MSTDEILLSEVMRKGLLDEDQIEECKEAKRKFPGQSMLSIIKKKGYLTLAQLESISGSKKEEEEEEAFLSSDTPESTEKDGYAVPDVPSVEEMSLPKANPLRPEEDLKIKETFTFEKETKMPVSSTSSPLPEKSEIDFSFSGKIKEEKEEKKEDEKEKEAIQKRDTKPLSIPEKKTEPASSSLPKEHDVSKGGVTPFGKAAILLKMATLEQVNDALLAQVTNSKGKKLGEIMLEKGYLTSKDVHTILARQKTQTLGCPKCDKKYQIVLYQKGRSYKCKTCAVELVEARKLEKKQAGPQAMPEKLQIMGLTQAVPKMQRKDATKAQKSSGKAFDTQGIDFAMDGKEVLSTEDMLKKVGIEPVQYVQQTYERPQNVRKPNYVMWLGLPCVLALGIGIFLWSKGPSKPSQRTDPGKNQRTEPLLTEEEEKIKKMNEAFQLLSAGKSIPDDERALTKEGEEWKKFLQRYPQTPYRLQAVERITEIENTINYLKLKKDLKRIKAEVEMNLQMGNFTQAFKSIEGFPSQTGGSDLDEQVENLKKEIEGKSAENMQRTLTQANDLLQDKKFAEAIALLQKDEKKQIPANQKSIAEKIAEINQKANYYKWLRQGSEFMSKTFEMVQEKNFSQAVEIARKQRTIQPQFAKEFERWQKDLEMMQNIWEGLEEVFKNYKTKKITLKLEGGQVVEGKVTNFVAAKELVLLAVSGGLKGVKLEQISIETVRNLVEETFMIDSSEKSVPFGFLLLCWKDPSVVRKEVPDVLSRKDDFIFHMMRVAKNAIKQDNMPLFAKTIRDLKTNYENTEVFVMGSEEIAHRLWSHIQELLKKKKKPYARKVARLLYDYLENTAAAKEAKKVMGE